MEKTRSEDGCFTKILATSREWPRLRLLLNDAYPSFSPRTILSEASPINKQLVWKESSEQRLQFLELSGMKERYKRREEEKEGVSSYWMSFSKREDTEI